MIFYIDSAGGAQQNTQIIYSSLKDTLGPWEDSSEWWGKRDHITPIKQSQDVKQEYNLQ